MVTFRIDLSSVHDVMKKSGIPAMSSLKLSFIQNPHSNGMHVHLTQVWS